MKSITTLSKQTTNNESKTVDRGDGVGQGGETARQDLAEVLKQQARNEQEYLEPFGENECYGT